MIDEILLWLVDECLLFLFEHNLEETNSRRILYRDALADCLVINTIIIVCVHLSVTNKEREWCKNRSHIIIVSAAHRATFWFSIWFWSQILNLDSSWHSCHNENVTTKDYNVETHFVRKEEWFSDERRRTADFIFARSFKSSKLTLMFSWESERDFVVYENCLTSWTIFEILQLHDMSFTFFNNEMIRFD